jgi:predicted TIM-barrel fold metal-dependent hydrolase
MKRILIISLLLMMPLPPAALGQAVRSKVTPNLRSKVGNERGGKAVWRTGRRAQQQITPLIDYHTHIFTVDAFAHITEPLLPVIELPAELDRLLRDKERFGGSDKNPAALADLYTKDALVLDAGAPTWLRGERAIKYIIDLTVIAHLLPTAYEVNGSVGYIAGTEAVIQGSSTRHVSNFLYVIRKEADGKWRISSEVFTLTGPPVPEGATAEQLIGHLDAEGIKRALVLSTAYWFGSANERPASDEYAKVRAENDWVARQVARYPNRLVAFCSFNPLKDYALEELNRCAKNPNLKGLKLHFGDSGVDLLNPQHVEKLRRIFRAANDMRFPIVVHLLGPGKFTRQRSEVFLSQILPVAPDIPIQIAHLGGSGPGYDGEESLGVYVDAIAAGDPRMKNVYFDVASEVTRDTPPETLAFIAKRLRQLGLWRVLYGSDRAGTRDDRSRKGNWDWAAFRRLPLTEKEFRTIAENVAPYMR